MAVTSSHETTFGPEIIAIGDQARISTELEYDYLPVWRSLAKCVGQDVAIFYLENEHDAATAALGKQICAACEVKVECLENAIRAREKFGIWGGLTTPERKRLIRRRLKASKKG